MLCCVLCAVAGIGTLQLVFAQGSLNCTSAERLCIGGREHASSNSIGWDGIGWDSEGNALDSVQSVL